MARHNNLLFVASLALAVCHQVVMAAEGDAPLATVAEPDALRPHVLLPSYVFRGNLDNRGSDMGLRKCGVPLAECIRVCNLIKVPEACVGFTYVAEGPNSPCCYPKKEMALQLSDFRDDKGIDKGSTYAKVFPASTPRALVASVARLSEFSKLFDVVDAEAGKLVTFLSVWDFQQLSDVLDKTDNEVTILAPSDNAFAALHTSADAVRQESPNLYKQLLAHVIRGRYTLDALLLMDGSQLPSLNLAVSYIVSLEYDTNTLSLRSSGLDTEVTIKFEAMDLIGGAAVVHITDTLISPAAKAGQDAGATNPLDILFGGK
ncbi:hypothetical protein FOA52_003720 [Chlamydomonas sp. UWO 241]|nr:hypothetical protein FOA52_003720 [Chlamydomonas sp. UWO 241]